MSPQSCESVSSATQATAIIDLIDDMPAFWIGRRSPHSTALPSDKLDLIVNLVLGLLGIVLSVIAVWQGYWIWRIWTTSKEQPSVTEESTTAEEGEHTRPERYGRYSLLLSLRYDGPLAFVVVLMFMVEYGKEDDI